MSFIKYISEHYTNKEISDIVNIHESEYNRELLMLSKNLLIWTFVGVAIDLILLSGAGLLTLSYGLGLITVAPTLVFFVVNISAKYVYVRWYTKNKLGWFLTFQSVLPYVGSILIITFLANKNTLYVEAFKSYLKQFKKEINWNKVTHLLKNVMTKSSHQNEK